MDIEKFKEAIQRVETVKQNRQQWIENYKKDFEALFEEIADYINKKIIPELNPLADLANQLKDCNRSFYGTVYFRIAYNNCLAFADFSICLDTEKDAIKELCLETKKRYDIEKKVNYEYLDENPNATVKLAELLKDARRTYKTNLSRQVKSLYDKFLKRCETVTDFPEGAY